MAKFSAMTVSSILKQGLNYSASSLAETAAFELPKLGATLLVGKYLGMKALPGIGIVNPALSLQIVNVAENFILGSYKPQPAINQTGEVKGRTDSPSSLVVEKKGETTPFSSKGQMADYVYQVDTDTPASDDTSGLEYGTVFSTGKFNVLRGKITGPKVTFSGTALIPPKTTLAFIDRDTASAQPPSGVEAAQKFVVVPDASREGSVNFWQSSVQPTQKMFVPKKEGNDSLGNASRRQFRVNSAENIFLEEFAQSHRFFVVDSTASSKFSVFEWVDGYDVTTLAAGFSSCTPPTMQATTTEIKEGTWECPRVFITGLTAGHITLRKGIVRTQTGFYLWMLNALRGLLTRRTIQIVAYRGGGRADTSDVFTRPQDFRGFSTCVWELHNCLPISYRPSGEWDADSGKVQIAELDMHYEWFTEEKGNIYKAG